MMKKFASYLLGLIAGLLNGLFGAGGGIAVVPMLEGMNLPPQKSHATSIAIILPLSIATTLLYLMNKVPVRIESLLWLVPFGLVGAVIGTNLLRKIPGNLLRRIFGLIIIYSGVRLLFF